MFEEQDQALEVARFQFSVDAVERMRDCVRDVCALKITLQREDIVADHSNVRVMLFRNSPDENVDFARVVREVSRDLLADERVRQIPDRETTIDRIVISDRHEVHSALEQLSMQLA